MQKFVVYQEATGGYNLAAGIPVDVTGKLTDAPERGEGAKVLDGYVAPRSARVHWLRTCLHGYATMIEPLTGEIYRPMIGHWPSNDDIVIRNGNVSTEIILDDRTYIYQPEWSIPSGKVMLRGREHTYFQYPTGELYLFVREAGALSLAEVDRTSKVSIGYVNGLISYVTDGSDNVGYSRGAPNLLWRGRSVVGLYHCGKLIALAPAAMHLSRRVSWREGGRKIRYEYRPESQAWVAV